ncbi:NAD-dependent epimerase/dehydratase family protein [Pelagibacterium limicola]|uniref:NAD-dependent epimerase/dehydratase family protein n=1 Tax=Pelagibacterium limicola TaxID=2791022 RepID=UPI0018AFFF28|nr:NAD-dependent epimerase/dehydratase family protein [Pelagibacterium limicola]
MRVLVTGSAGFIGYHLSRRLLADGHEVLGYDGMTPYYDVSLKRYRNAILAQNPRYRFVEAMLEDRETLDRTVSQFQPRIVVHLAAQAGVRYSIEAPQTYISSNVVGTANLIDILKVHRPDHFLFASTSSVYGGNEKMPFEEAERTDFPVSLYAATKKAGEALTHSFAHLNDIPTTCFRFFTVYGTAGRPDMALYKFVDLIERGEPIEVYGNGEMERDATSVDDLVEAIVKLFDAVPVRGRPVPVEGVADSLSPVAPWRVVNIAGGQPVRLMTFIQAIEAALGRSAEKIMLPMQQGDVVATFADPSLLKALTGFVPEKGIEETVGAFVKWYRAYKSGE